ncbi:MAG: GIY-YIG catalytic domain protein [Parcubacteria group bacterium GW2011_GWF2_46_8]|nr:MAG: GIY-YIG catalytic domain protein [Parcubacteria group bacterium GW2011_GWF2_46_8]
MHPKKYTVYVVRNSKSGKIYIGQTVDLEKRLKRHDKILPTKDTSFTSTQKGNGTWQVIYQELFDTRDGAINREKELKTSRGRSFIHNIINGRSVS